MGRLGSGMQCGLVPVFSCGRSLYIDWRMVVVVGEECFTPCKTEGEWSGRGKCPEGNMSEEEMSRGECPTIAPPPSGRPGRPASDDDMKLVYR